MKQIVGVSLVAAFLIMASAPMVSAQTPATTANKIAWDQQATTLAEAQAYTYKYYPDGATTGVTLTGVVCTSVAAPTGSLIQCEVAFPAFTPGSHTLTLTASNQAGESAKSAPLSFAFVLIPQSPNNLRIK